MRNYKKVNYHSDHFGTEYKSIFSSGENSRTLLEDKHAIVELNP